ncbi:hypothetical protein Moror_837 [Moniliophthora roreri MCA 2997]|nr:hypothetical protein Moror_837 [Moniliophthora roreri MCA 2997]KAI3600017.1 hypothetical protein WG66_011104 [Moniliophthora roreri]
MHPNKRRKLNEDESRYVQAIIPEVDVEIGLRERLAETIEARIAWALALQDSLTKGATTESELSFKDVALQALDEIESRTAVIFHNEQAAPVSFYPIKSARPPPKEKPNTRSQKAKFIYLRSDDQIFLLRCSVCSKTAFNALQGLYNHGCMAHNLDWGTQEECVKACAVPQKRLDHELDLDNGIDVSSVAGVRPGVRSLFEMAVEGTYRASTGAEDGEGGLHLTRTLGWHSETPALARFLGKEARRRCIKVWDQDQVVDVDGFGGDANTLINENGQKKAHWRMPYTHRSVPKEDMNIEDAVRAGLSTLENGVDSPSGNADATVLNDQSSSRFHITCRITVTDYSLYIPPEQRSSDALDHTHKWMITVESSSYSLDLTTVLKKLTVSPLPDETGISDPDLFDPISTTEPPFLVVGTTAEPFLAKVELKFTPSTMRSEGQTVILEHWVGLDVLGAGSAVKGDEQVTDIELDKDTVILPAKTGYTPVKSKQHWERTKIKKEAAEYPEDTLVARVDEEPLDYNVILKSLLPKFPMTMKDRVSTRGSAAPRVPYRLVADHQQLKTLVVGRRKAIEWARAKAIRDAYMETVSKESAPSTPLTAGDVFCWLEDEGHFIREEKVEEHHEIKGKAKGKGRETPDDKWCRVCGLGLSFHNPTTLNPTVGTATTEPAPEAASAAITNFRCRIAPKEMQHFKMPTIDVEMAFKEHLQRAKGAATMPDSTAATRMAISDIEMTKWIRRHRNHNIVTAVEPNLTKFVLSQALALRLSNCPPITSGQKEYPINLLGTGSDTVDTVLAPHAYLALAMKQFIQYLVRSGLEISKRDTEFGVGFTFQVQNRHGQDHYSNTPLLTPVMATAPSASGSRKKSGGGGRKKEPANKVQSAVKVLTPMHILSGVISRNTESRTAQQYAALLGGLKAPEVASAVYRCLAQLGIGVHDNDVLSE